MYPLTCAGGFNVPSKKGKFEIVGFSVTVDDLDADAEFAIIDDETLNPNDAGKVGQIFGSIASPTEVKYIMAHEKFNAGGDRGVLEWFPPCSVKTRYGLSLYFDNIKQGSVCVYVR